MSALSWSGQEESSIANAVGGSSRTTHPTPRTALHICRIATDLELNVKGAWMRILQAAVRQGNKHPDGRPSCPAPRALSLLAGSP